MPRQQKTISIPLEMYREFEEIFKKLKPKLKVLGITSVAELIRVAALLGQGRAEQLAEITRVLTAKDQATTASLLEDLRKTSKNRKPPQPHPT